MKLNKPIVPLQAEKRLKMPTKEQIQDIWEAQFELFGGYGLPESSWDKDTEGHGIAQQQFVEKPVQKNKANDFSGGSIGWVEYNPETGEQKIIRVDHNE